MLLGLLKESRVIKKKHLIAQILVLAFNSAHFRFTSSLAGQLEDNALVPSGNILKDMVIPMAGQQYAMVGEMLEQFPFAADLLDQLENNAIANADIGAFFHGAALRVHLHTGGVANLYDLIKNAN